MFGTWRCFEVTVQLIIKNVSCPGVWLSTRGEVYLTVQLFDRIAQTFKIRPLLPLVFNEKLYFRKLLCVCSERADVYGYLYDEIVDIRLIQVDKQTGDVITLATYATNLRDFLSPLDNCYRLAKFSEANDRQIFLRSTAFFPGYLDPRLRFLTTATIQKCSTTSCCNCIECCKRSYEPRKTINFEHKKDRMDENRPAFVVRKVDSKLLSRVPSLYRESPGRKTYCCSSPHRLDDCAACRVRKHSPSPVRRNLSTPRQSLQINLTGNRCRTGFVASASSSGFHETRSRGVRLLRNLEDVTNVINKDSVGEEAPEQLRGADSPSPPPRNKSPELLRLPSPQRYSILDQSPFTSANKLEKSPILHRPTFQERFGSLPDDAIPYRNSSPKPLVYPSTVLPTHNDHFGNVDDTYEIHTKEPHYSNHPHNHCCCHECSHVHCPQYWRSRLGPSTNHYNWYSFRHGLNCIYDDFYRKVYPY